jgi:hypothetical protein
VTCRGLGNATPQETISPERSATGFSVASKQESALGRDMFVVIAFIRLPFRAGEKAHVLRAFSAPSSPGVMPGRRRSSCAAQSPRRR